MPLQNIDHLVYLGGGAIAIYVIKEGGAFALALVDRVKGRVNGKGVLACPHAEKHDQVLTKLTSSSEEQCHLAERQTSILDLVAVKCQDIRAKQDLLLDRLKRNAE